MGGPTLTGGNGWKGLWSRLALSLGLLLPAAPALGQEVPNSNQQPPAAIAAPGVPLDLSTCLRIALEKQPTLAALRASLAAAQVQQQGLEDLHAPPIFAGKELPIRRKQACLGVIIAEAGLNQAQWETLYAVQRTYFSAVFAREQLRLARDVEERLKNLHESATTFKEAGAKDVTESTVGQFATLLHLSRARKFEAELGLNRAQAALREAMGVDCGFPVEVADQELPSSSLSLCKEEVVSLALSRRGELVQVVNAAEITALEIDAQAISHATVTRTFAAGSDFHAQQIPAGLSNGEYRPGAIGLEMPTIFAGPRDARVERAKAFHARASAVVDKTRNLIVLEAEDAFLRWQENSMRIKELRQAEASATKIAEASHKAFVNLGIKSDEVLLNRRLALESQVLVNEARYQQILALAALERITAGGICTGLWVPNATQP